MIEHLMPAAKAGLQRQQRERQRQFERRLAKLPLGQQFKLVVIRVSVAAGIIAIGLVSFAIFGNQG